MMTDITFITAANRYAQTTDRFRARQTDVSVCVCVCVSVVLKDTGVFVGVRTYGQMGSADPWEKWMKNDKAKICKKEQFSMFMYIF